MVSTVSTVYHTSLERERERTQPLEQAIDTIAIVACDIIPQIPLSRVARAGVAISRGVQFAEVPRVYSRDYRSSEEHGKERRSLYRVVTSCGGGGGGGGAVHACYSPVPHHGATSTGRFLVHVFEVVVFSQ